jgi:asparagine N-glycosylation enzyme membrane subunit Stt3
MAQAKVESIKVLSYYLEDVLIGKQSELKKIKWTATDEETTKIEFFWHVYARPIFLKIFALFFFMLSVFSFLGSYLFIVFICFFLVFYLFIVFICFIFVLLIRLFI